MTGGNDGTATGAKMATEQKSTNVTRQRCARVKTGASRSGEYTNGPSPRVLKGPSEWRVVPRAGFPPDFDIVWD